MAYRPAGLSEDDTSDSDDGYYGGFSTGGSSRHRYKFQPPANQVPVKKVLTFEEALEDAIKNDEKAKMIDLIASTPGIGWSDFIRFKPVNGTEYEERTVIMIAGRYGHFSTIEFVLNECGTLLLFEMNRSTLDKYTELMAIANPHFPEDFTKQINQDSLIKCATIIINRLASLQNFKVITVQEFLNLQDKYGRTCLIIAAMNGLDKLVKLFIDHGSDVNITDNFFKTALICAAERNSGLSIRYLLEAGADVHNRDIGHKSALDFAVENENSTVTDILHYASSTPWLPGFNPELMEIDVNLTKQSDRFSAVIQQEQEQIDTILITEELDALCTTIFESHSITFVAFLQMDENDLIEMGVINREDRKKILGVIDSILDRDWNSATVLPIDMRTEFSPSEITCLLLDSTLHISRQLSCIRQIREGIQKCPTTLQKGIEIKQIPHLIQSAEKLVANSEQMVESGKKWLNQLEQLFGKVNRKKATSDNKINRQRGERKRRASDSQKGWANKLMYLFFGVSLIVGVGFVFKKKDIQYSTLIDHLIPNL